MILLLSIIFLNSCSFKGTTHSMLSFKSKAGIKNKCLLKTKLSNVIHKIKKINYPNSDEIDLEVKNLDFRKIDLLNEYLKTLQNHSAKGWLRKNDTKRSILHKNDIVGLIAEKCIVYEAFIRLDLGGGGCFFWVKEHGEDIVSPFHSLKIYKYPISFDDIFDIKIKNIVHKLEDGIQFDCETNSVIQHDYELYSEELIESIILQLSSLKGTSIEVYDIIFYLKSKIKVPSLSY